MSDPFELLIRDNSKRLRNICRSYADYEEQEDLFQEMLEQLWRSQKCFRGESHADTWLYRVAINTAVSYQRKKIQQRKARLSVCDAIGTKEPEEKHGLDSEQLIQAFSQALSSVDKVIFVLYVNGLTSELMSSIIGLSGNAIKVRISRMKTQFRQQFVD